MTEKKAGPTPDPELRRRAEAIARKQKRQTPEGLENLSTEAVSALVHNLQVHQIELELQNEELRLTQVELGSSRAKYFELYDMAPVGYFLLSEQGLILEANLTFAAMLGLSKAALLKQPFSRFVFSQDQDNYYLYRKSLNEAGGQPARELRLVKSGGTQVWILLESNLARAMDGTTIIRAAASDVTQLKLIQQALQSSQARYRALMDQSFEALLLVDIQTREVVEVNRRFTELFGYSLPADAPLFVNQIAVDSDGDLDVVFNDMLRKQRYLPREHRIFRHKKGVEVPVERTGTVISVDGRDYLLNSLRDMTVERRRKSDMARDVEFARRVQQGLLPEPIGSAAVDIKTLYYPSHFVSGDSFLLEWRREGKLLRGFLFDVSGHGLATALQAASINVLLREATKAKSSLPDQLQWVNKRAAKYFAEGSYAAIIGFELDLTKKELRYVGAGITQFFANGEKIETPGMFVGLWDTAQFITGVLPVNSGDGFYFLTDGFTDVLTKPEHTGLLSAGGRDFSADVAALDQLGGSGKLRDDASGICLSIQNL